MDRLRNWASSYLEAIRNHFEHCLIIEHRFKDEGHTLIVIITQENLRRKTWIMSLLHWIFKA